MNRQTFNELLKSHGDQIYSYAYYFLRDRHDAEDVAQEVFLRLWRSCDAEDRQGMVAWLTRVAHNLCIDLKRRRRTAQGHLRVMDATALENVPAAESNSASPEENLERSELQAQLLAALATLPAETESVMLLHYFQGLTFREIAARLGINETTAKVRVHRGRKVLRKIVAAKLAARPTSRPETKREAG
jgi:RNA polymerase sigma-70 factor (ECF subfamily)